MDAREELIERRDTHLDQLTGKLKEGRVHKVISELLGGDIETGSSPPSEDDQLYAQDLGLISRIKIFRRAKNHSTQHDPERMRVEYDVHKIRIRPKACEMRASIPPFYACPEGA